MIFKIFNAILGFYEREVEELCDYTDNNCNKFEIYIYYNYICLYSCIYLNIVKYGSQRISYDKCHHTANNLKDINFIYYKLLNIFFFKLPALLIKLT